MSVNKVLLRLELLKLNEDIKNYITLVIVKRLK
jgi:hypothetical protein